MSEFQKWESVVVATIASVFSFKTIICHSKMFCMYLEIKLHV